MISVRHCNTFVVEGKYLLQRTFLRAGVLRVSVAHGCALLCKMGNGRSSILIRNIMLTIGLLATKHDGNNDFSF